MIKFKKYLNKPVLKNKTKIKKVFFIFSVIVILVSALSQIFVSAEEKEMEYYKDLYNSAFSELENYDFKELDKIINDLNIDLSIDFKDIISKIMDGTFDLDSVSFFDYIISILFDNIKQIIPICALIICVAIIVRCLNSFSPSTFKDGINDIINFVAMGIIIIFVSNIILNINDMVYSNMSTMQNIINIIFPILITLMGAIGASSSVAIYTPITTILNTGVSNVIANFLYPIYTISFALIVISSLTSRIKINKLIDFLGTLFKTSVTFIFSLFSAIFVIKGISAGKYDSVSIYTTKFAVKNYIPIIGTYISEGFNYIMLSSVIVKNAIGFAGIILILFVILMPVVYLLVIRLMLFFTSSIVEILGNSNISNMLEKVAKIMAFPITVILGVAFMFIMTIALLLCTANLI